MTQQIRPDSRALLLRQVGEALYGASWQAQLSSNISVSDRSIRRWASGEDEIPPGAWRDIHYVAESQWRTVEYFDKEILKILAEHSLQPIANTRPLSNLWGLNFSMATGSGRPVRCFIMREVFDDRVEYQDDVQNMLQYFEIYADVFYAAARRKYDFGDITNNQITIGNADLFGDELPDVRRPIYTDASQSAVLRHGNTKVDCLTLQEAVLAWSRLDPTEKRVSTLSAKDGGFYRGAQIGNLVSK